MIKLIPMIVSIIFIIVVKIISFLSYLYFLLNINFDTVIVENTVINDDINIIFNVKIIPTLK